MPLYLLIEAHVFAAERLHGDDTTVPVLAKTRTDTDRIRAYVRDDRPFGSPAPPSAIFHYSRNRWGEHPVSHLRSWRGILQADAYAGYNALFHGDRLPAPLTRALCWRWSGSKGTLRLHDAKSGLRSRLRIKNQQINGPQEAHCANSGQIGRFLRGFQLLLVAVDKRKNLKNC